MGHIYQEFVIWIMITGLAAMILVVMVTNKKVAFLKENVFYAIHLIWVILLSTIGILLEKSGAFDSRKEIRTPEGQHMTIFSNTLAYDIFVFLYHALIFGSLILIVTSIRQKKMKPVILSISSILSMIIYFWVIL